MCGIHVSIDRTSLNFIKSLYFSSLFYFILFDQNISHLLELFSYIGKRYFETCHFLFSFLISLFLHFWKLISQVSYLYISGPKSNGRDVRCLRRLLQIYYVLCWHNTSKQMNSMLWVFFKQCSFSMFTCFHTFKFWVSLCATIFLSSFCVLPIPLFLCKCLNLCSSAAKRKRKIKKELMHILISVSMLLLYQNYLTCFHGGCISVFFFAFTLSIIFMHEVSWRLLADICMNSLASFVFNVI